MTTSHRSPRPGLPRKGSRMRRALDLALARQSGERPMGGTDRGGRWYPADAEFAECCEYIREPSRTWPWTLYKHCNSVGHVACLIGVGEGELRVLVRSRTPKRSEE